MGTSKKKPTVKEATLARLRKICLALPEATEHAEYGHYAFKVREKTFAWQLNDHHGDGRVSLTCKAPEGVAGALVAEGGDRWFIPP